MEEFLKSRVVRYIIYFLVLSLIKYFTDFETTVLWIGAYLLVDTEFIEKNQTDV